VKMRVEVAIAWPERQCLLALELPEGADVSAAIAQAAVSGIPELAHFEKHMLEHHVGIFSRLCPLDQPLQEGDRVEIYRPLQIDPKVQRRARAQIQGKSHKSLKVPTRKNP
jgi:uncharacterized protein